jgi:hypothetical protein
MRMPLKPISRALLTGCGVMTLVVTPLAAAGTASATSMVIGRFTLTGSVQASITTHQARGYCGEGAGFEVPVTGHMKLPFRADTLVLDVSSTVHGTTTNISGNNEVSLFASSGGTDSVWYSVKGSITNNANSGAINVSMAPESGLDAGGSGTTPGIGTVHIVGSWKCQP